MAVKVYNLNTNFSAISNCSIEGGSVKAGLLNFATDATGTGLNDFTQHPGADGAISIPTSGTLRMQATSAYRDMAGDPATMETACYVYQTAPTDGNFVAYLDVALDTDNDIRCHLFYRIDDTNYVSIHHSYTGGTWYTYAQKVVSGTRSIGSSSTAVQSGSVRLQLERDGNNFALKISANGGSTLTTVNTISQAFGTGGNVGIGCEYYNAQGTMDITQFAIESGFTGDAEALINEPGVFTAKAVHGKSYDLSTAAVDKTGLLTPKYQYSPQTVESAGTDAAAVDADVEWNGVWLTLAELQAEYDPADTYLYLKTQLTGATGAGDTFDSFSVEDYDTTYFSAITNCSIVQQNVVPGLFTFADAPNGTGLDDFTQDVPATGAITLSDGSIVMQASGVRILNNATGTLDGVTNMLLNAATDGDFDVYTESPITAAENVAAYLMYRIDDTNLIGVLVNHSFGLVQMQRFVAGTRTASAAPSYSASTTVGLRLKRVGNVFTSYYRDDGGAWAEVESYTQAYGTGGSIGLAADNSTIDTVTFSEIGFLSGFTGDAEALVNEEVKLYTDVGVGKSIDVSTASERTTGSPTVSYQYESRELTVPGGTPVAVDDNVDWNTPPLSLTSLQSEYDTDNRYLYLKVVISGPSGSTGVFNSFDFNTYDTTYFSALKNCSIIQHNVVPWLFNFAAKPTSTGLDDFTQDAPGTGSITLGSGKVTLTANTGGRYLILDPGTLDGCTNLVLDAATAGDFDVTVKMTLPASDLIFACLLYVIDDTNIVGCACRGDLGSSNFYKWVPGSRTTVQGSTNAGPDCAIRLVRNGNTFNAYVSNDGGDTFTANGSTTQAFATNGKIVLAVDDINAGNSVEVTELSFASGFTGDVESLINSDGQFNVYTPPGFSIDMGTIIDGTTGAVTTSYQIADATTPVAGSDAVTVDANADWNGSWLTLVQLQGLTDPNEAYIYVKVKVDDVSSPADTYDRFDYDTYLADITPPTAPTGFLARKDESELTLDVWYKWKNGNDGTGAGFAGASIRYYDSSDDQWYNLNSDGSWTVTEDFDELSLIGIADTEENFVAEDIPTTAVTAGVTCWDLAGNNSARLNMTIYGAEIPDYPDVTDVFKDIVYANGDLIGTFDPYSDTELVGELDLPAEADVRDGVLFDSDTKEGVLNLPAEANVRDGVLFDNDTKEGVLSLPAEVDVRDGVLFDNDTKEGVLSLPAESNVRDGVFFDNDTKEGVLDLPPIGTVLNGTVFDDGTKTGIYTPDFPDAVNVLNTDTVNGAPGRWYPATADIVALGETIGIDGESILGTYGGSGVQTPPATYLNITVSEDQFVWDIDIRSTIPNVAVFLYDNVTDELVDIAGDDGTTRGLVGGRKVYCRLLAANASLSVRYPLNDGFLVPELPENPCPSSCPPDEEVIVPPLPLPDVQHPYIVPEDPSSVCSTGLLPHILTGVVLQILRHHFSSSQNIVQTPLNGYTWARDEKLSKILIETTYNWSPKNIQQRPAVLVKRGQLTTQKLSIGNRMHGPPNEEGFEEDKMMVAFKGSHSIFCCGRTGTEAELLGAEVAYELLEFSQVIREQFGFMSFDVHEVGQMHRLQESHDHFAVPVSLTYGFSHGWFVLRQRPIWMSIGLEVSDNK